MALKSTIAEMRNLLHEIVHDLEKAEKGNRAAAQRTRTRSIKFAKVSKLFRKESVSEGKKGGKKAAAKKRPAAKKKPAKRKGRR